jgi:hypothetical protein
MTSIPQKEPESIRAGDTWKWLRSFSDYPATGWTLKYRFKNASAGFEIAAVASGTEFSIDIAAATTPAFPAGTYTWISWVEGGSSEKYTLGSGSMEVLPDFRTVTANNPLDSRSHAKKMVDAIEAWLENRDPAVEMYEINGRRMKFIPIPDLIKLRNNYKLEVAAEANAEAIKRGEGIGRKIQFRI